MTTKNFKVKNGIDIGDDISINDDGTIIGLENTDLTLQNLTLGYDLESTRIHLGPIRQATADSESGVFKTGANLYKGLSIDNANDLNARATLLQRSYGFKGAGPYVAQVYEAARGTAAAPARLNNGDSIFTTLGFGYFDDLAGSANWSADATGYPPFIMRARAADNWTSATNSPTKLEVLQLPAGAAQAYSYWTTTDIGTSYIKFRSQSHQLADGDTNNLILTTSYDSGPDATVIQGNRSRLVLKNDSLLVKNNGDTQTLSLDSAGNLSVLGDVGAVNGDFTGNIGAIDGNFTGDVGAVNGNFTGDVGAVDGNFTGNVGAVDITATDLSSALRMATGPIRQTTADAAGDILWYNVSTGQVKYRGLSVNNADGSNTPTRRPTVFLRAYNTNSTFPAIVTESARGTEAAPAQVNANDTLFSLINSAYYGDIGTGSPGWNMDAGLNNPSIIRVRAAENFSSKSNVSTKFEVLQFPSGADSTSSGNYKISLEISPANSTIRSDFLNIFNSTENEPTTNVFVQRLNATSSNNFPTINFVTRRASGGTLANDVLGEFKFNGGTSPNTNTAQPPAGFQARARENFTLTEQGSEITFRISKLGSTDILDTMTLASDATTLRSDSFYLEDSDNVPLKSGKIDYARTHGCWHKVATVSGAGFTSGTAYTFDWYNNVDVHHDDNVSNDATNVSRINFADTGTFMVQVQMQAVNTDNNSDPTIRLWLKRNGSNITESTTRFTISKAPSAGVPTYNLLNTAWMIDVTAGEYIEVGFRLDASDTSKLSLQFEAAGTNYPSTPSAILMVRPVGA